MRQRISLDKDWKFALGHAADASKDFEFARDRSLVKSGEARGAAGVKFDDSGWRNVNVPHDWAIELPTENIDEREFCEHGFRTIGPAHPQNSVGWYRKPLDIAKSDRGRRISIEFEGVFRDSIVWINGHRLGRHASGYTPFRYDVTDLLTYGGQNVIAVRVDATGYEGWWYEGAGINRHVWLLKTRPVHIVKDGVVVRSTVRPGFARLRVQTTLANESDDAATATIVSLASLVQTSGKRPRRAAAARPTSIRLAPWSRRDVVQTLVVRQPLLWSCETPYLYQLQSKVRVGANLVDRVDTRFGIRTIKWDSRRGFFLNGRPLKIKGTCNHHQHVGVGTAVPDALQVWRLQQLKDLGSNAYRCSHYMVPPATLDACDRLGLLVMAENRLADTGPDFLNDFKTMIRRDRNHPSIILWSIGNEEHSIQWSIAGERIGKTLRRVAHELDPTRCVTAAMHDRGLGEGFANVVDVHGWNYISVGDIEKYHKLKPAQPIVGSEEGSTVCTRGEYEDDAEKGFVSSYDRRSPKWGSMAAKWWPFFAERDWIAGGFVWTGFDYYGEPIPYKWPCTASHFGLMDLCGFPKDLYYYFKAWWGNEPVLHLFPHWNWIGREGQVIDVWCYSNHEEVELQLNGQSLGRKSMPRNGRVEWKVHFTPGRLEAVGFRGGKCVGRKRVESTGAAAKLIASADRTTLRGEGDVACVAVSIVDAKSRLVPTADDQLEFNVTGAGKIIGVGNGDPSSHEPAKGSRHKAFHGLAQVIVQSDAARGSIQITATAAGMRATRLKLLVR